MWSLSKLWQGDKKFRNVLIVVILLVIFLAYMDIRGLAMFDSIGQGYTGEVYKQMEPGYMNLFWTFAYMIGFAVAIVYYLLRKDVSESVALFSAYIILILGGLEDIFYYWFQGRHVDLVLPWLDKHIFMGTVANVLGFSGVTNISLYISVALAFVIVYIMVYYLKRMRG